MMPKFWEVATAIRPSSNGENLTAYPLKSVLNSMLNLLLTPQQPHEGTYEEGLAFDGHSGGMAIRTSVRPQQR